MASQHSTNDIPTYATPARRPTAKELRKLPDDLLVRLYDIVQVVSDTDEDGEFVCAVNFLLDDIHEAARIPEIRVPVGTEAYDTPSARQ